MSRTAIAAPGVARGRLTPGLALAGLAGAAARAPAGAPACPRAGPCRRAGMAAALGGVAAASKSELVAAAIANDGKAEPATGTELMPGAVTAAALLSIAARRSVRDRRSSATCFSSAWADQSALEA